MCEEGGCFRKFAKVILIIVNIIFLLAGLLMFAFGISLVAAPSKVIAFLESSGLSFDSFQALSEGQFITVIKASGIFMIVLGIVVALVACLGFFGACCENKCLLITYAVILIIVLLAEIALIIFAAVYNKVFQRDMESTLTKTLVNFGVDVTVMSNGSIDYSKVSDNGAAWIAFQTQFQCCGSHNYTDYEAVTWNRTRCEAPVVCPVPPARAAVPLSCCVLTNPSKKKVTNINEYKNYASCLESASEGDTNRVGCTENFIAEAKVWILRYGKIAIGIAAGIVGLEIILLILTFFLCCTGEYSNKYV